VVNANILSMFHTDYATLLAAKSAKGAGPGPRKGKFIHRKQYIFSAEMIICKALARRIADDSSQASSDHEGHSDEINSLTHSLHGVDSDGGEVMDLDEDTDLNGQDSRHLVNVFQAEVCLEF
jgi:hypothetical protein